MQRVISKPTVIIDNAVKRCCLGIVFCLCSASKVAYNELWVKSVSAGVDFGNSIGCLWQIFKDSLCANHSVTVCVIIYVLFVKGHRLIVSVFLTVRLHLEDEGWITVGKFDSSCADRFCRSNHALGKLPLCVQMNWLRDCALFNIFQNRLYLGI